MIFRIFRDQKDVAVALDAGSRLVPIDKEYKPSEFCY
jgi:hypothetical protein